jgi:tetratricopeptide (TPR) repeat protein
MKSRSSIQVLLLAAILLASITEKSVATEFQTSCNAELSGDFAHAVTLLHSFEYPATKVLFQDILASDPQCAMARWGIAMSIWQPLWAPPSPAELDQGMKILEPAGAQQTSEKEALYLEAIRAYFSDDDPAHHAARASAYSSVMQRLYEDYHDDPDVTAFYALSLLAVAATNPSDKSYALQYKAGSILSWVRESYPDHPGVLHYIIHSYDYPGLAHLALGAARVYARAAPDSAHAQHMPSHIFTRLGLWDESIASNLHSTASATEYTHRAGLSGYYDEGLHSIDYLMYAYLQTGRDKEALQLLTTLTHIGKTNVDSFKVAYTDAASPARYALERHQWREASELELKPGAFPWERFPWASSIHHFARGIGAARSGRVKEARAEHDIIRQLKSGLDSTTLPYWREQVFVHDDAVSSWIALADGDDESALGLAEAAANREDAVDKHPVTPGEVLPARELYADMLLQLSRNGDALDQYRRVLKSSPNRYNALLGAARAAVGAGNSADAILYYGRLVEIAGKSNSSRESLAEATRFLAGSTLRPE